MQSVSDLMTDETDNDDETTEDEELESFMKSHMLFDFHDNQLFDTGSASKQFKITRAKSFEQMYTENKGNHEADLSEDKKEFLEILTHKQKIRKMYSFNYTTNKKEPRKMAHKKQKPGFLFTGNLVPLNECNFGYIKTNTSNYDLSLLPWTSTTSLASAPSPPQSSSLAGIKLKESKKKKSERSVADNFEFMSLKSGVSNLELDKIELDFGDKNEYVATKWSQLFGSLMQTHKRIVQTGLTLSQAKEMLRSSVQVGTIYKRGFRFRRQWKKRFLVLQGRMLRYYDVSLVKHLSETDPDQVVAYLIENKIKPKGVLELAGNAIIAPLPDMPDRKNAFIVYLKQRPSEEESQPGLFNVLSNQVSSVASVSSHLTPTTNTGVYETLEHMYKWFSYFGFCADTQEEESADLQLAQQLNLKYQYEIWRFSTQTASEKAVWIERINTTINLINRVDMGPTLAGMGSVTDHFQLVPETEASAQHLASMEGARTVRQGFGSFVTVQSKATKALLSLKCICKATMLRSSLVSVNLPSVNQDRKISIQRLFNEIRVLRKVGNIGAKKKVSLLRLFHVYEDNTYVTCVFNHILPYNLVQGLSKYLTPGLYSVNLVSKLVSQIGSALKCLHDHNIVVVNLSLETILLKEPHRRLSGSGLGDEEMLEPNPFFTLTPVICDFRDALTFSSKVNAKGKYLVKKKYWLEKACVAFMPPDTLFKGHFSVKGDVYSLGVILLTLLTGENPLGYAELKAAAERKTLHEHLASKLASSRQNLHVELPDLFTLLSQMLAVEHRSRCTLEEVLQRLPLECPEPLEQSFHKLVNGVQDTDTLEPELFQHVSNHSQVF